MAWTTVTTWSLEVPAGEPLAPRPAPTSRVAVRQVEIPTPEYNRFLYSAVGGEWYWVDRLGWSRQQWLDWLERPEVETWVLYEAGAPAGYFELELQADGVEIAYFGLLPQAIGRGLGGYLLSRAVERARQIGNGRVWLHTCSLDGPNALANYLARGFRVFATRTEWIELPDRKPSIWVEPARLEILAEATA